MKLNVLQPLSIDDIMEIVYGSWMADAACKTADPKFFFPPENSKGGAQEFYRKGRKVCAACPVRDNCLRMSLLNNDSNGLWGGMTPKERAAVDNQQRWGTCHSCRRGFHYTQRGSRRLVCGLCHKKSSRQGESEHYD